LGKKFPVSTHEGLLIIPAVQVDSAQGQYWSTGSEGWLPLSGQVWMGQSWNWYAKMQNHLA
jgi:hypothetical protein